MFSLPKDEIYLGMGVHGEPGLKSIKLDTAQVVVAEMMDALLADLPFKSENEVLVFVNGMGSTTLMELFVIYNEVATILKAQGIKAYKPLIGEYITTQEMAGFSISLCRCHDDFKRLWDAPVSVPYFHR
jgi:dihydroxyacetone kinase-like protein